jgi:hypothetical protein
LKKIGLRQDKQEEELALLRKDLSEVTVKLDHFTKRVDEIDAKVDGLIEGLRSDLERLAKAGRQAKAQSRKSLEKIHKELSALITCLELSLAQQFDPHRQKRLSELLTKAKSKRTRIGNVMRRRPARRQPSFTEVRGALQ